MDLTDLQSSKQCYKLYFIMINWMDLCLNYSIDFTRKVVPPKDIGIKICFSIFAYRKKKNKIFHVNLMDWFSYVIIYLLIITWVTWAYLLLLLLLFLIIHYICNTFYFLWPYNIPLTIFFHNIFQNLLR